MDSKDILRVLEGVISRPCCSVVGCDENCPVERIWPLVKALREQLDAAPKWISVKDALPERNMAAPSGENHVSKPVLAFGQIRGIIPEYNVAVYHEAYRRWELEIFYDNEPHTPCAAVTHWMPLPEGVGLA